MKASDGSKYICKERDAATALCTSVAKIDTLGATTDSSDPGDIAKINQGIDFFFDKGPFTLSLDDAEVYPITTAASSTKGTYLVKLSVLEDNTPEDTEIGPGFGGAGFIYAEKTFLSQESQKARLGLDRT